MLIASGYLPAGYLPNNAFGQIQCALVLEPFANRLQALAVAEGGNPIDDLSLGGVAAGIGGSGGGVYSCDPTSILGSGGGWALPVSAYDDLVNGDGARCDCSAGNVRRVAGTPVMAFWFEVAYVYIRSIGRHASVIIGGAFSTNIYGGCYIGNPRAGGACGCPSGTGAYPSGQFSVYAGSDSNAYLCQ